MQGGVPVPQYTFLAIYIRYGALDDGRVQEPAVCHAQPTLRLVLCAIIWSSRGAYGFEGCGWNCVVGDPSHKYSRHGARDMQQGTHGTLYCFPVRLSMTVNESSRCCLAFDAGVSWPMLLHFALGFVARMVPGQRMLIYIQDC